MDYNPSVISISFNWSGIDNSIMTLFSLGEINFQNAWQSALVESVAYHNPYIIDMDSDGKKDIALAGSVKRVAHIWEQISAGVVNPEQGSIIDDFQLYPNYPGHDHPQLYSLFYQEIP